MGVLAEALEPYASMKGLHLFHFGPSNCSQRVRIALEEKGLKWESHAVNLVANEHLQPAYQRLHPKGVVPALVHDGVVVIESNDIIAYLDTHFPERALTPINEAARSQSTELLALSSSMQMSLKLLSYRYFFGERMKKTPEQLAEYDHLQQNKALVSWQTKFSNDEFSESDYQAAVDQVVNALTTLEETLSAQTWLSGEACGLADISWVVNVYRFSQIQQKSPGLFDLAGFKALSAWFEKMQTRESVVRGLIQYNATL